MYKEALHFLVHAERQVKQVRECLIEGKKIPHRVFSLFAA